MQTGDKYFGRHRGIVIQNDSPNNDGKVKVFVPHINMTLFEGWNKDAIDDKFFRYPGKNLESALTPDIILRLKESLPWAEVAFPIFGPSGSGYYNSETDIGTIEDGPIVEENSDINNEVETPVEDTSVGNGAGNPTGGDSSLGNSKGFDTSNYTPVGNGSALHGDAVAKDAYLTFYDHDESLTDPYTAIGKTSTDGSPSNSYYGLRDGGTQNGEFRYATSDIIGVAAVDPDVIRYGSIIELRDSNNSPLRFIAADTGGAVKKKTAAISNGSNFPVIDLFMPKESWNKTIFGGETQVYVYPYQGSSNYTKLSSSEKENIFKNNSYSNLTLPSGDGSIDSSLFPTGAGTQWSTSSKDINYSVSVHYNRDGSIRSASTSGPITVDLNKDKIIIKESSTGDFVAGSDLNSLSPRFKNAWNPQDWTNIPKESRTLTNSNTDYFDLISNNNQDQFKFRDPSVFQSTPSTKIPTRTQSQFYNSNATPGSTNEFSDFATDKDQLIIPSNIKQSDNITNSIGNSFQKDNGNGINSFNANSLNPQKTSNEGGDLNGDPNNRYGKNSTIVNYNPNTRAVAGNGPKGMISLPNVGNHVWVEFENGNPLYPIITGSIYTREDYLLIAEADESETEGLTYNNLS